jgi:hypothetical protein
MIRGDVETIRRRRGTRSLPIRTLVSVASTGAGDTPGTVKVVRTSTHEPSRRPWFQRHPLLALAVSAVLFAGIFVLQVSVEGTEDSISMLYALPVALVALGFGFRAGSAAGLAAIGLLVVWAVGAGATFTPLGWVGRVTPLVLLGTLIGFASDRMRQAERTERHAAAVALLQREGAEISDRIFQGLAASKWMLEVGEIDRGLATLEDTMLTAQQLVTKVLGSNSVLRDDVSPASIVAPSATRARPPRE